MSDRIGIVITFPTEKASVKPLTPEAKNDAPTVPTVTVDRSKFTACRHGNMVVDEQQRTVQCGDCEMWLDPVWCLKSFYDWDRMLDSRIAAIQEFDKRERAKAEAASKRKAKNKPYLRKRRDDELERAAYNEYKARQHALMAERQKQRAQRLDDELGEHVTDEVEAAAARERMKSASEAK